MEICLHVTKKRRECRTSAIDMWHSSWMRYSRQPWVLSSVRPRVKGSGFSLFSQQSRVEFWAQPGRVPNPDLVFIFSGPGPSEKVRV